MSSLTRAQTDRPGRALVVDDDPIVRKFISAVLRMRGFEPIEAAGAKEALLLFQAGEFSLDLVIMDVHMPEMSGCDLAQVLLAAHPNLPILLVSGSHSQSPVSLPFLQKPFTPARLLEALQGMMPARSA